MKRKLINILIFSLILLIPLMGTGCQADELTKVSLSEVAHTIFYAPQYVAISQGFFEEEGLDIELTCAQGADKVTTAVLSGDADIGFCGPEATIYVYNEGKDDYIVTFAQLTKRDGSFLLAREKSPNFTFEEVKGKTIIGGRKGGMPEMTLEWVLKQKGIKPDVDVFIDTSIQFAAMSGAFIGGTGDYVSLFEPTALALEQEGVGYVVASIGEESGELPYTCYNAKKSFIEKNPEIVQKFTNAIYKGQIWVDTHSPREIAEAIVEFFPDTSIEDLTAVADRYKKYDAWKQVPTLSKESFELLQDIIQEAGVLDKRVPYEALVNTEFAEKAIKTVK
ncbi:MAG: ABC transporter substrate-binding protein [Clostridiales bacterium]|nr:ABC transporter substrate-binding protein [Clostridiales bacterium]